MNTATVNSALCTYVAADRIHALAASFTITIITPACYELFLIYTYSTMIIITYVYVHIYLCISFISVFFTLLIAYYLKIPTALRYNLYM